MTGNVRRRVPRVHPVVTETAAPDVPTTLVHRGWQEDLHCEIVAIFRHLGRVHAGSVSDLVVERRQP